MSDREKRIDEAINSDYTPGPWEIDNQKTWSGDTVVFEWVPYEGELFGKNADKRLAAAAPDLADAYREKSTEVERLRKALIDIAELQNDDQDAKIAREVLAETGEGHE